MYLVSAMSHAHFGSFDKRYCAARFWLASLLVRSGTRGFAGPIQTNALLRANVEKDVPLNYQQVMN